VKSEKRVVNGEPTKNKLWRNKNGKLHEQFGMQCERKTTKNKKKGHRLVFFFIQPSLLNFLQLFSVCWVSGSLKNEQRFKFMCCGSGDF